MLHVYSGRDLPWQLEMGNWRADGELGADGEGLAGALSRDSRARSGRNGEQAEKDTLRAPPVTG